MKSPLLTFISVVCLSFLCWQNELKANPECNASLELTDCSNLSDDLTLTNEDNPCYPPYWHYTSGITQNSATFQWEPVSGANYYSVQWRYPGGSWNYVQGYCYQSWINVYEFQPCSSYEWRVQSHCGYGYSSSWCSPVYFNTLCNYCPTPTGCYYSDLTSNSVNFYWDEIWGAQGYHVQMCTSNGYWYDVGNPCQYNWLSVYNLQPGTWYQWRVRTICGYNGYSNWSYYGNFTTPNYYHCYPPSYLQCYNITGYSATWKWEPVYGADYYTVQWCYQGGTWYDLAGGPIYGTWVNVNHLSPCTTYQYRVRSHCHYETSSYWCSPYTFTTTCNYSCGVPTGLHTIDIGDTRATLKWAPVSGATSYSVQIKDYWGNWYDVPGSPTSGIWITAFNLTPCKTYEWRVKANCPHGGYSYWSASQHFTTTCGNGCDAPHWVYTNGISSSTAVLHWEPSNSADYYVVEYRIVNGTWTEYPGGPFTNTILDISGLQSNTTYEWRVKSHCHTGQFSPWSSITYFTTAGGTCGMPLFRYTLPITDSTATFNWSAVPGALNYTVQFRPLNGQWHDVPGSPTTGTSITVTGLLPNTMYEWQMRVNCTNGAYSPWLGVVMFITGNAQGCSTPAGLFADQITLSSAALHWNPVQGAVSYAVEMRALPHGTWQPAPGSPVDTNYILIDSLHPFTTYEWHVRATCAGDVHSFWSGVAVFTTEDAALCDAPVGLHSGSVTDSTATLIWFPVPGAQGYQVQTRLPNGMWVDWPGGTVVDTSVFVTGLTSNTTYEWHVRTVCDSIHFSHWSVTKIFTTTGVGQGNNDCASAMLLHVESTCVTTFASNVDATASEPPPMGGCESHGYKDVWFKFNMPDVPNPTVTIRTSAGSLADAVMEVYSGTECSFLSLIACEDNNDNGNGSLMPVINLTGTPNATIWVRVWGNGGATGTFTICVFNYISFNYAVTPTIYAPGIGDQPIELQEAFHENPVDQKSELYVSPNPVRDELNVEVMQSAENYVIGLRIMDLSGQIVLTQAIESSTVNTFKSKVDVSDLVPGIYVLQVQTSRGVMAEKISVIR